MWRLLTARNSELAQRARRLFLGSALLRLQMAAYVATVVKIAYGADYSNTGSAAAFFIGGSCVGALIIQWAANKSRNKPVYHWLWIGHLVALLALLGFVFWATTSDQNWQYYYFVLCSLIGLTFPLIGGVIKPKKMSFRDKGITKESLKELLQEDVTEESVQKVRNKVDTYNLVQQEVVFALGPLLALLVADVFGAKYMLGFSVVIFTTGAFLIWSDHRDYGENEESVTEDGSNQQVAAPASPSSQNQKEMCEDKGGAKVRRWPWISFSYLAVWAIFGIVVSAMDRATIAYSESLLSGEGGATLSSIDTVILFLFGSGSVVATLTYDRFRGKRNEKNENKKSIGEMTDEEKAAEKKNKDLLKYSRHLFLSGVFLAVAMFFVGVAQQWHKRSHEGKAESAGLAELLLTDPSGWGYMLFAIIGGFSLGWVLSAGDKVSEGVEPDQGGRESTFYFLTSLAHWIGVFLGWALLTERVLFTEWMLPIRLWIAGLFSGAVPNWAAISGEYMMGVGAAIVASILWLSLIAARSRFHSGSKASDVTSDSQA